MSDGLIVRPGDTLIIGFTQGGKYEIDWAELKSLLPDITLVAIAGGQGMAVYRPRPEHDIMSGAGTLGSSRVVGYEVTSGPDRGKMYAPEDIAIHSVPIGGE